MRNSRSSASPYRHIQYALVFGRRYFLWRRALRVAIRCDEAARPRHSNFCPPDGIPHVGAPIGCPDSCDAVRIDTRLPYGRRAHGRYFKWPAIIRPRRHSPSAGHSTGSPSYGEFWLRHLSRVGGCLLSPPYKPCVAAPISAPAEANGAKHPRYQIDVFRLIRISLRPICGAGWLRACLSSLLPNG